MILSALTKSEQERVRECLVAIMEGPWIDDWEFQTRLGIDREELGDLIATWPRLDDAADDSPARLAINNCMNEVCNGVPISAEQWNRWFTVSREEIRSTYGKWLG